MRVFFWAPCTETPSVLLISYFILSLHLFLGYFHRSFFFPIFMPYKFSELISRGKSFPCTAVCQHSTFAWVRYRFAVEVKANQLLCDLCVPCYLSTRYNFYCWIRLYTHAYYLQQRDCDLNSRNYEKKFSKRGILHIWFTKSLLTSFFQTVNIRALIYGRLCD